MIHLLLAGTACAGWGMLTDRPFVTAMGLNLQAYALHKAIERAAPRMWEARQTVVLGEDLLRRTNNPREIEQIRHDVQKAKRALLVDRLAHCWKAMSLAGAIYCAYSSTS